MAEPNPLQRYLLVQQQTDREMAKLLTEAADEAEAMVARLADSTGVGVVARRAQFQATAANLRRASRQMWVALGETVSDGMNAAGLAAAEAAIAGEAQLWARLGGQIPELNAALREQARQTVNTYKARLQSAVSLSQQVYNTSIASDALLNRTINLAILQGKGWQEISKDVKGFINPDTPGGASYAAKRLARTELNNAFHQTQITTAADDPFVTGLKWNLSGSHPKPDACNDYAERVNFKGGGPGVFKANDVPRKPHPQCMCFMTPVTIDEEEFINQMVNGYGPAHEYVDGTVYRYGTGVC